MFSRLFKTAADSLFIRLAKTDPEVRAALIHVLREAKKWDSLPKGWTQKSVEKFWESLTGKNKHKVTKCIKKMEGKLDGDPGAFCASLADKIDPGWRSRRASGKAPSWFSTIKILIPSVQPADIVAWDENGWSGMALEDKASLFYHLITQENQALLTYYQFHYQSLGVGPGGDLNETDFVDESGKSRVWSNGYGARMKATLRKSIDQKIGESGKDFAKRVLSVAALSHTSHDYKKLSPKWKTPKSPTRGTLTLAKTLDQANIFKQGTAKMTAQNQLRSGTLKEFNEAVANAKWPQPRRMSTKRTFDAFYSDRGTPVAEKHQILSRGKIQSETYMVNPEYLKGGSMSRHAHQIAKTILDQMGGQRRLMSFLGAKNFIAHPNGVSFKWPNKQRSKGNYVKVTLRRDDTYDMEFQNVAGMKAKVVKKYQGVYADQLVDLFEGQTGWYLRLASQGKKALDPGFLKGREKMVSVILSAVKAHAKKSSYSNVKTLITGFIYSLYKDGFRNLSIAKNLWNLFEHGGPSLDPVWAQDLAYQIARRLGHSDQGMVEGAAISMSLLRRGRMTTVAGRAENLFDKVLAKEIAQAIPTGIKPKSPGVMFEESITPEIQQLASKALREIGGTPEGAETLSFWVAEDINWHDLNSVGVSPDIPRNGHLVQSVSQKLDYGLEPTAAFIVALLRLAGLRRQAEGVKKEALREFSDSYVDMGIPREASQRMAALSPEQAFKIIQKENPNWPEGDLWDAINTVSPRMTPDAEKVQTRYWKLVGKKGASRVTARWIAKQGGLPGEGKTFESTAMRWHVYHSGVRVWDLTFAGKRGKNVEGFALYDLDYVRDTQILDALKEWVLGLAKQRSYRMALDGAQRISTMTSKGGPETGLSPKIEMFQEKGVDVAPAGFKPIKLDTPNFSLEADFNDFVVRNRNDTNNEPTCIPHFKGGKRDIKVFFRWVKDNQAKLRSMTYNEVLSAMRSEGIKYHSYCAMD